MTDLKHRRVDFQFDDSTPFQWLPDHPKFGMMCNAISVLAIAFEHFIVATTRPALAKLGDPAVAEEARAFIRQEAVHSKNHKNHIDCLIRRYPGLRETVDEAIASYDKLIATTSLAWQLAYTADVEATFTSTFKVMLDHEDELFRPGHEKVASLFLWHFCEEIEHRSSALIIYNAVVKDRGYRSQICDEVFAHVLETYTNILRGFDKHVPFEDRGVHADEITPDGVRRNEMLFRFPMPDAWRRKRGLVGQSLFGPASNYEMLVYVWRLAMARRPQYKPEAEPLPRFADSWFKHYDEGFDVTHYYSSVMRAPQGE